MALLIHRLCKHNHCSQKERINLLLNSYFKFTKSRNTNNIFPTSYLARFEMCVGNINSGIGTEYNLTVF